MSVEIVKSVESVSQMALLAIPPLGAVLVRLKNKIKPRAEIYRQGAGNTPGQVTITQSWEGSKIVIPNDAWVAIFPDGNDENKLIIRDFVKKTPNRSKQQNSKSERVKTAYRGHTSWLSTRRKRHVLDETVSIVHFSHTDQAVKAQEPSLQKTKYSKLVPYDHHGDFGQLVLKEMAVAEKNSQRWIKKKIAEGFIGEQEAETLKTPVDFQSLIELKTRDVLVDQLKADNPGWERSQLWWQSVVDNILLGNKPTYLKVDFSFLRTY